ncbi:MAG: TIGR00269 family protein [Methanomicrobiales archaeon]|jgi:uncharacterized protein (TIGR00269 family)|nr:TIGR00269 family protein [Methanomicrobiales archaeon]
MVDRPRCAFCAEHAIFIDRASGLHLCGTHLKRSVEERVFLEMQMHTLPPTLGVAFSGGKDSTALLAALTALQKRLRIQIIALTVDEGIAGYREDTISHAKWVCQTLHIPHKIISFKELFGWNLDEMISASCTIHACTVCGIFRRRALEVLAEREGVHTIATGHNQNDAAQTFLMNLFSADLKKMVAGSFGTPGSSRFSKRIKPFSTVSEREVTLYGVLCNLFKELVECPYAHQAVRGEVRSLLSELELHRPGTIAHTAACERAVRTELLARRSSGIIPLVPCSICGWPGSHAVCQVCTTLEKINQRVQRPSVL